MKNKIKMILALTAVFALLLGLAGCAEKPAEETSTEKPAQTENTEAQTEKATEAQETAPEHIYDVTSIAGFNAADVDGSPVTADFLKEHRLTLVNVMSSTCGPCMEELPTLMKLSDEYKDLGFLGIDLDMDMEGNPDASSAEIMQKLLKENGGSMKIIFPDDVIMMQVLVNMDAMPYTFFVNEEGKVVGGDYLGGRNEKQWREIIKEELGR